MRDDTATLKAMLRLVDLLEGWADWVRAGKIAQGCHRSSIFAGAGMDFEDLADKTDKWRYETVDTAIDDLPADCMAAIQRRYGIRSTWSFPRCNYEQSLLQGHEKLLVDLPRRHVVF